MIKDNVVFVEDGDGSREEAVEHVGDRERDETDVGDAFHAAVHRGLHASTRQHHHAQEVPEDSEDAESRIEYATEIELHDVTRPVRKVLIIV